MGGHTRTLRDRGFVVDTGATSIAGFSESSLIPLNHQYRDEE